MIANLSLTFAQPNHKIITKLAGSLKQVALLFGFRIRMTQFSYFKFGEILCGELKNKKEVQR